jgi:hypothetical protein
VKSYLGIGYKKHYNPATVTLPLFRHCHATAKAREFLRRYQHLSQHFGYNLVYDTISLIQEFIPCWSLGVVICRPKTLDMNNVEMGGFVANIYKS